MADKALREFIEGRIADLRHIESRVATWDKSGVDPADSTRPRDQRTTLESLLADFDARPRR